MSENVPFLRENPINEALHMIIAEAAANKLFVLLYKHLNKKSSCKSCKIVVSPNMYHEYLAKNGFNTGS